MNAEILGVFGGAPRRVRALQADLNPSFTLLPDPERKAAQKTVSDETVPAIGGCDRFGAIWEPVRIDGITPAAAVAKTAETLAFMALPCPECGAPDRPPP